MGTCEICCLKMLTRVWILGGHQEQPIPEHGTHNLCDHALTYSGSHNLCDHDLTYSSSHNLCDHNLTYSRSHPQGKKKESVTERYISQDIFPFM